jgi:hypothetical protein
MFLILLELDLQFLLIVTVLAACPVSAGLLGCCWIRRASTPLSQALTQPTGINKPLIGPHLPWVGALQMDGTNDLMVGAALAAAGPGEMFFAAHRPNTAAGNRAIWGTRNDQSPGEFVIRALPAGNEILMFLTAGNRSEALGAFTPGQWQVIGARRHAGGADYFANGVTTSQAFANIAYSTAGEIPTIGANPFDAPPSGDVAALVYVPAGGTLADAQIIQRGLQMITGQIAA